MGGIGDLLGSAVDVAIGAVEQHVGELIDDPMGHVLESVITGGPLGNLALDLVEEATGVDPLAELGAAFDEVAPFVDDLVDVVSAGSLGSMLNVAMDRCGLPDWAGDVAGGVLDAATGNYVGAAANGLDALEDVAKACGGDEIAGYLKMGAGVTGMFAGGGIGQLGAGGAKAAEVLAGARETIALVDAGIGAAERYEEGDYLGAATAVLEMTGADVGAFSGALGVDPTGFDAALAEITTLASEGAAAAREGLVELRDPAKAIGAQFFTDMLGGASLQEAAGVALEAIAAEVGRTVSEAVMEQLEAYLDEILAHVDFGVGTSGHAREVVDGLLQVAASLCDDVDMGARQGQNLRV